MIRQQNDGPRPGPSGPWHPERIPASHSSFSPYAERLPRSMRGSHKRENTVAAARSLLMNLSLTGSERKPRLLPQVSSPPGLPETYPETVMRSVRPGRRRLCETVVTTLHHVEYARQIGRASCRERV